MMKNKLLVTEHKLGIIKTKRYSNYFFFPFRSTSGLDLFAKLLYEDSIMNSFLLLLKFRPVIDINYIHIYKTVI